MALEEELEGEHETEWPLPSDEVHSDTQAVVFPYKSSRVGLDRGNNSLFSLLMTHDSCGRGCKIEGETEGSFSDRARKMANYPWFPKIRGGPLSPCPAKYSAVCMHLAPQRCLLEDSLALCVGVFSCVQYAQV